MRLHWPSTTLSGVHTRTTSMLGAVGAAAFVCLFTAAAAFSASTSALVPGGYYQDAAAGGTRGDVVCPTGVNPASGQCVPTGVSFTADPTGTYFLPWSFEANNNCRGFASVGLRKPYARSDRMTVSSKGTIHRVYSSHGTRFEVQAAVQNRGRSLKGWFSIRAPAGRGRGSCTTGRVKFNATTGTF
jgi:hypothetical protein